MKILIIGGSGDIGSALVTQFLTDQPGTTVYATYRTQKPPINHERLFWFKINATSEQDITSLANQISNLDIVINAVGILQESNHKPEKSVREFNSRFFEKNIMTNVTPSIYLAKHLSKHLKSNRNTFFVAISARIGSIEDNNLGGWISYRCSKAALNMAVKTISIEWKYKLPNCCVIVFHPGSTDTSLSKLFQKNIRPDKLFSPQFVAQSLASLLEQITPADSGQFYSYDGTIIPW